jgi:hypothetical protein
MIRAKKVDFTPRRLGEGSGERTQQLTINQVVAGAQHAALNVVRGQQEARSIFLSLFLSDRPCIKSSHAINPQRQSH